MEFIFIAEELPAVGTETRKRGRYRSRSSAELH